MLISMFPAFLMGNSALGPYLSSCLLWMHDLLWIMFPVKDIQHIPMSCLCGLMSQCCVSEAAETYSVSKVFVYNILKTTDNPVI